MKKFVVTLYRTEIYSADLEVEAEDEEAAIKEAKTQEPKLGLPWTLEQSELDFDIISSLNREET